MRYKDLSQSHKDLLPSKPVALDRLADGRILAIFPDSGMIVGEGIVSEWLWANFTHGTWEGEERRFWADGVGDHPNLDLVFIEDCQPTIGIIISDRIDSSIVYSETVSLGGGWMRAYLRRNPDGSLFTQTMGSGLDGLNPAVIDQVAAELEASVREAAGV